MKQRDGTNQSTAGSSQTTGSGSGIRWRLLGLGLMAVVGTLLVIWVSHSTWERLHHLRQEFDSLKVGSFYLGARMQGDIQRLNDTLLRYRLRGDMADYDEFQREAAALRAWLAGNHTNAATALERDFFAAIRPAYEEYLGESTTVLEANRTRWLSSRARIFQDSYEKVQRLSQGLLRLCDQFIANQRSAFGAFGDESKRTLAQFEQLLKLSLALLLALAAALTVLVYRGMIAPLRHQLNASQAIIARQEKLASLGVLAAGVAHEIRNPLTAIKFRLFSLRKFLPTGGDAQEDAAVIAAEISRLEQIVRDVLQFARPAEPRRVNLPARRVLEDVRDLLRPQLEKVAIELQLGHCDPAWVCVDTPQIKQVLINLVQNSADSIERNGTITMSVRDAAGHTRKNGAARVLLEVTDNGKGIPPDVQARLFDPFFTTREGGTGLGLPIAARIVEKHGGELRYQTQLNRGTTFAVVLPRADAHET